MFLCGFWCIKSQNSILLLCAVLTSVLFTWNYLGLKKMVDQILTWSFSTFLSVTGPLNCRFFSLPEVNFLFSRIRFTLSLRVLLFIILNVNVILIIWCVWGGEPAWFRELTSMFQPLLDVVSCVVQYKWHTIGVGFCYWKSIDWKSCFFSGQYRENCF